MATEIEAKLRYADFDRLRGVLMQAGATPLGAGLERNLIFDRADGSLREADCGLRIRTVQRDGQPPEGGTLTFKGPRQASGLKSREEIEATVDDAEALHRILEALGYRCVLRYEKRRESWALGAARVELDEVPLLGRFVEVEAGDEATVHATLARLGLAGRPLLTDSYIALLLAHLSATGRTNTTVTF